jgi:hypothetical protein
MNELKNTFTYNWNASVQSCFATEFTHPVIMNWSLDSSTVQR